MNIEIILYKTLVRPCITYGAEFWTLTAKDVRAPRIFGMKIQRRCCGPMKYGEDWVVRHSHKTNEITGREKVLLVL